MTKVVKWFKKVSFWMKLKGTITALGVGGELTLIMTEQSAVWHYVTIISTFLGIVITNFIEDKNNDGVVDLFEDGPKDTK